MNIHRAIELQFIEHLKKNDNKLVSWPKRLHICFDNAPGENINVNVFSYLATLVHHGVFLEVSVGTLIVGHTHNINDQLFSVWSRWLNVNDCISVTDMIQAFSENYRGWKVTATESDLVKSSNDTLNSEKIKASATGSDLVNGNTTVHDDETSSHASVDSLYMHIPSVVPKAVRAEMKRSIPVIQRDIIDAAKVAKPYLERVTRNIDVQGWITDTLKKDGGAQLFEGITKYHVFMFVKNQETKDTEMLLKFEANSHVRYPDRPHDIIHNGEKYRKKKVVIKAERIITEDPMALPFNFVDTTSVELLLNQLKDEDKHNVLLESQLKEMKAVCTSLGQQYQDQSKECSVCESITAGLRDIGTLHRPKQNDTVASEKYKESSKARTKFQADLLKHMGDPAFKANHADRIMHGWWTKWLNDRIPMIQQYYSTTGSVVPISDLTGLLTHPADQTNDEVYSKNRVEADCIEANGPPRPNDFVLTRAEREENKPPFWLGKIIRYFTPSKEVLTYYENVQKCHEFRVNNSKKVKDSRSEMPELPQELSQEMKMDVQDESWYKDSKKNLKRGKDQLQHSSTSSSLFMHTHLLVDWYAHVEETSTIDKKHNTKKRKNSEAAAAAATSDSTEVARSSKRIKRSGINYAESEHDNDEDDSYSEDQSQMSDDVPLSLINATPIVPIEKVNRVDATSQGHDKWKTLKYLPCHQERFKGNLIPVSTIIWWDRKILTTHKTLLQQPWEKIIRDLNQSTV